MGATPDGRSMLCSFLALITDHNLGKDYIEYGKIQDLWFPPLLTRLFGGLMNNIYDTWRLHKRGTIHDGLVIGMLIKPNYGTQPRPQDPRGSTETPHPAPVDRTAR